MVSRLIVFLALVSAPPLFAQTSDTTFSIGKRDSSTSYSDYTSHPYDGGFALYMGGQDGQDGVHNDMGIGVGIDFGRRFKSWYLGGNLGLTTIMSLSPGSVRPLEYKYYGPDYYVGLHGGVNFGWFLIGIQCFEGFQKLPGRS